jgi:hypothetical protein
MPSQARQTANQENATRSTGPRTPEGKARSSQNARKHGLTAAQLVIAAEDREEFDEFLAELQTEIRPQGPLQQILFDQLAASAWNLRRIRLMEAEIAAPAQSYADILNNPDLTAQLDRLARHNTRIERTFHRALRELKALQTDAALASTLPAPILEKVLPLASRVQIAKRTQALALAGRQNDVDDFWSGADAETAALKSAFECHTPPETQTAALTA